MQKLKENHGTPKVSRALRYAAIRLLATPETAGLAAEIEAERTRLSGAQDAYEQIREQRVGLTALIAHQDGIVDGLVADIARQVAVINGNRTDTEFYKSLFPVAPSKATSPKASESQNRFVKALIDRIETDARYETFRTTAAELKAAQTELDRLLVEREELRAPELRAAVDLRTALDSARRAYNKLSPRLQLLFDNKGLIETFFIAHGSSSTAEQQALDESLADSAPSDDLSAVG